MEKTYTSFQEFYPYYLSEHSNPTDRLLHYIGTTLVISLVIAAFVTGKYWLFAVTPFAGYTFAWVGHFFIEKNKPATFQYPFYSLAGDFKMYAQALTGTLPHEHFINSANNQDEVNTAK